MKIDEYLYTLNTLLGVAVGKPTSDGVELSDRMSERLAYTVFAVGKQYGWNVEIYYDEEGSLITDVYK